MVNCVDCKNMKAKIKVNNEVIDYGTAVCSCSQGKMVTSTFENFPFYLGVQFLTLGEIVGTGKWERDSCDCFENMND